MRLRGRLHVAVLFTCGWFILNGPPQCFDALIDYSEGRTRDEIRKIPDGIYHHEECLLEDGAKGGPQILRLKLTVTDDQIEFDFTGTDPQSIVDDAHAHCEVHDAALCKDTGFTEGFDLAFGGVGAEPYVAALD